MAFVYGATNLIDKIAINNYLKNQLSISFQSYTGHLFSYTWATYFQTISHRPISQSYIPQKLNYQSLDTDIITDVQYPPDLHNVNVPEELAIILNNAITPEPRRRCSAC